MPLPPEASRGPSETRCGSPPENHGSENAGSKEGSVNERESLHGQKCAGFVPVSRWIEVYLFDPLLQAARPSRHAVLLFCLAASGLIFAGDLLSPSAAVPEILYGAVLLGSLWTRRPAVTVGLAGLCTFLIPLGHFLQLQEIPLGVAVANRSFILLMLWVVTGLVCAVHSILACVQERTRALHEDIRRREEAEEALHLRSQQLESVRAVTEEIARELDLTALLHLIHERVLALAQGDSGTVWLWDEGAQLLLPTSWPGLGAWMGDVRLRPNEGVAGTVAARRQGMCVNDFRNSRYVGAARKQGVDLTVCGEAAGTPEGACLLVGMGVRALSMDPFRAARVRHVLRQLTLAQMESASRDALGVTTSEDVRQIAASALRGTEV